MVVFAWDEPGFDEPSADFHTGLAWDEPGMDEPSALGLASRDEPWLDEPWTVVVVVVTTNGGVVEAVEEDAFPTWLALEAGCLLASVPASRVEPL